MGLTGEVQVVVVCGAYLDVVEPVCFHCGGLVDCVRGVGGVGYCDCRKGSMVSCEWETFVLTSTSSGSTAGIAIARAWLRGIYSKSYM